MRKRIFGISVKGKRKRRKPKPVWGGRTGFTESQLRYRLELRNRALRK